MTAFQNVSAAEMNDVAGGSVWSTLKSVAKTTFIVAIAVLGGAQLLANGRN